MVCFPHRLASDNPAMAQLPPLSQSILPSGIRSRFVEDINGLRMHILEAGHESGNRPLVLLLHGFPELAYSWRKVMLPLAAAGYHVVAPDQRGYGRTTGWDGDYDGDVDSFRMLNLVHDVMGLVSAALGAFILFRTDGSPYGTLSRWAIGPSKRCSGTTPVPLSRPGVR